MTVPTLASILDLSGKVALVTGGGQGIGEAICRRLAEAGAAVVITDIKDDGARVAADIAKAGGKATFLRADVAVTADAQRSVAAAVNAYGRLDVLVNNAALVGPAAVLDIDEALWDRVLDIDLKGVFFQAQAAARQFIKQGQGGKIINIASVDAVLPVGGLTAYDAAKGGVAMLTKSLAKELGKHGITVNAVAPGGVDTPGAREATAPIMAVLGISASQMSESPIRSVLGRYAVPDDIARIVYFMATGLSNYMTGAFVTVDGGYLLV
jgi:glucose 1-dehydrogenase/2-deoxy-D-gluconate 3-dehydrogenase